MDDAFDPHHRELCPDGGCIGLIGPDGRCKVCGMVSPNAVADPRHQGLLPEPEEEESLPLWDDDDLDDEDPQSDAAAKPAKPAERAASEDDDFQKRQLCPDGGCIGLIGSDGRCKECGKMAESSST